METQRSLWPFMCMIHGESISTSVMLQQGSSQVIYSRHICRDERMPRSSYSSKNNSSSFNPVRRVCVIHHELIPSSWPLRNPASARAYNRKDYEYITSFPRLPVKLNHEDEILRHKFYKYGMGYDLSTDLFAESCSHSGSNPLLHADEVVLDIHMPSGVEQAIVEVENSATTCAAQLHEMEVNVESVMGSHMPSRMEQTTVEVENSATTCAAQLHEMEVNVESAMGFLSETKNSGNICTDHTDCYVLKNQTHRKIGDMKPSRVYPYDVGLTEISNETSTTLVKKAAPNPEEGKGRKTSEGLGTSTTLIKKPKASLGIWNREVSSINETYTHVFDEVSQQKLGKLPKQNSLQNKVKEGASPQSLIKNGQTITDIAQYGISQKRKSLMNWRLCFCNN